MSAQHPECKFFKVFWDFLNTHQQLLTILTQLKQNHLKKTVLVKTHHPLIQPPNSTQIQSFKLPHWICNILSFFDIKLIITFFIIKFVENFLRSSVPVFMLWHKMKICLSLETNVKVQNNMRAILFCRSISLYAQKCFCLGFPFNSLITFQLAKLYHLFYWIYWYVRRILWNYRIDPVMCACMFCMKWKIWIVINVV